MVKIVRADGCKTRRCTGGGAAAPVVCAGKTTAIPMSEARTKDDKRCIAAQVTWRCGALLGDEVLDALHWRFVRRIGRARCSSMLSVVCPLRRLLDQTLVRRTLLQVVLGLVYRSGEIVVDRAMNDDRLR